MISEGILRSKLWPVAALFIALQFSPDATAGRLEIEKIVHPTGNWPNGLSSDIAVIGSGTINPVPGETNKRDWHLADSELHLAARLIIGPSNVPQGFEAYDYIFRLPFTFHNKILLYASVIAKEGTSAKFVRDFIKTAHATRRETWNVKNITMMSHRARILFRNRLPKLRDGTLGVQKKEIRLAYWVLFYARELFNKRFVLYDSVTESARIWLLEQLNAQPSLFGTSTTTKAEAELLIKQTSDLAAQQKRLDNLVDGIDSAMKASDTRPSACVRAEKLWQELDALAPDTYKNRTNDGALGLRTLRAHADCIIGKRLHDEGDAATLNGQATNIYLAIQEKLKEANIPDSRLREMKIDKALDALKEIFSL